MVPRILLIASLVALGACSTDTKEDGTLATDAPTTTGDDDDTTGDDDDTTGDDDDDTLGDDDDDTGMDTAVGDDDDDDIPEPWEGRDCPNGQFATWLSGELIVFSDDPPAVGTLEVPLGGLYNLYDVAVAESGPGQTNESAFLRVPTSSDPVGLPSPLGLINCDDDYVALDSDNVAPPPAGGVQYLGTFLFETGPNSVEFHHYCEAYFAGRCTGMHDPGTTCETGINSVHFTGAAVCLVPVL